MYSLNKIIGTICLIGAGALAVTTAQAVSPPPDGGYPNMNTAEGEDALFSLTTGLANTAVGFEALFSNTTGSYNTAHGYFSLTSNTTGTGNTASGINALYHNTTGGYNTAYGYVALLYNTTGSDNTATGAYTLVQNTSGLFNTANGINALYNNTTGSYNTADGQGTLYSNTSGRDNVACGQDALRNNTTGSSNLALGESSGINLTTGNNNIDIGNSGVAAESDTIRIGTAGTQTQTFIAGVRGVIIGGAMPVGVSASGQFGVKASSARFKEAIKPMDKASATIFSLQPVTFRYKKALDPTAMPQFGLIAEQVAKVSPELVARDADGKPFTVRYEEVNAMLLNEFLKEHRKVQTLEASLAKVENDSRACAAKQQSEIDSLTAALKAQAAQIQEVSDRLEFSKSTLQMVADN